MERSSEHDDLETVAGGIRSGRAGLRVRPARAEPTGLFVAVEMTVLVIVAALAMASIIVSSNEMADREPAVSAPRHADQSAARNGQATPVAGEVVRGTERRGPADGIAR